MGNSLAGSKKFAKVMKINGETVKLKAGIKAGEVMRENPGYVLLESEAVKHYGIRAKPLETHQELEPKRLYFLVELPELLTKKAPRRVKSGMINMSAKDKLESLMLSRRSNSELSIMNPTRMLRSDDGSGSGRGSSVRLKMRLPIGEVERLMRESRDEFEAGEKIVSLCLTMKNNGDTYNDDDDCGGTGRLERDQKMRWSSGGRGRVGQQGVINGREKRVSFLPIREAEIQVAVTS